MPLLSPADWEAAEALSQIGYVNPFLPERIELERRALGRRYRKAGPFMQFRSGVPLEDLFPNFVATRTRSEQLLQKMRDGLTAGQSVGEGELRIYEDLALYVLYARYLSNLLHRPSARLTWRPVDEIASGYDAYRRDFDYYLTPPGIRLPSAHDADVVFAGLYQIERAFVHVFQYLVGGSLAAAKLRAAIWQSIFTHDMRRYTRGLHQHMADIPTLITGPTGTGKELVAKAIAQSRFIGFQSGDRRFVADFQQCFIGLNLSAIAPTLVESELFGHVRGSFSGAVSDRKGYLDAGVAQPTASVFLDEIGELDPQIQVKLLRVLQTRQYQRVGDSATRPFLGKIIAATHRDLASEMQAGRFREDLYYRLCADRIETPSLRAQLQEQADDLPRFVRFIADQLLPGQEQEADSLTDQSVVWIQKALGRDYPWPGNIRELEQCVRGILIRGSYTPMQHRQPSGGAAPAVAQFIADVQATRLARHDLLRNYASLVRSRCTSDAAAARHLGIDRRTIKSLIDPLLVDRFTADK